MTNTDQLPHTGVSRTSIQRNHAVFTPESHVPVLFPGWDNAEVVVAVSLEMGAKFEQYIVNCNSGAVLRELRATHELFVLVQSGSVTLTANGESHALASDNYAYIPPGGGWQIDSAGPATLLVFTKPYVELEGALAGQAPPELFTKALADVPAEPFLGDEGALLQVLLPDSLSYDWGINLFDFVPGGTLPNVESHFMEHGLFLLEGQGVYRLGEHWYPVSAGDCIWMGPYVPQWYVAAGKTHSRYLYYKEMNRPPIS